MSEMKIKLFPEQKTKKPMRNILGINNSPRITSEVRRVHDKALFDALNFRYIRYHDAPLENPGQQLIDIRRIFPLFHADETDPRNYQFGQCDDYLAVIADSGAEIDFRLGETIDHSGNARMISVPEDIEKWARICRNIIAHYKNGEMNGMHLNIRQVTVWEEPDNPKLLQGTVDQYSEMFCTVYKALKKDFPDLKVGGPAIMSGSEAFLRRFLEVCKENGVTPDYLSVTVYSRTLEGIAGRVSAQHRIAGEMGFSDMPVRLAEWHLGPVDWKHTAYVEMNGFHSAMSAAFSTAGLTDIMDMDYVEAAYFYAWATSMWSVMNLRTAEMVPYPVYYGLMLFQKLAAECKERLMVETENGDGIRVLSGRTECGKTRVLVSCYEQEACMVTCCADGAENGTLYSVEMDYCEESCTVGKTLTAENGCFRFEHKGGSGVYMLEF